MKITLRQLLIFTAVAETGSTTAAGDRLALSQSATSGALSELETILGTRLFDRIGKRLHLNDNGRTLLRRARTVIDGAGEIEREFGVGAGSGNGALPADLRISASTTIGNYLLPDLIAGYRQLHPKARFDVQVGNTREASLWVARLEVDIGLVEGSVQDRDVRAEPWIVDELVVVRGNDFALRSRGGEKRMSVSELREAPWLLREPGSGTREAVEHVLLPHLHQLREGMQFGGTEAIKQAAAAGLGLTCLSRYAVQDLLTLGKLRIVETTLPRLARRFYLIRHEQKRLTPTLQSFVKHCLSRGALGS